MNQKQPGTNYSRHREKRLSYQKKYWNDLRIEVLTHYSNGELGCECCSEKHLAFLSIDHINGGGLDSRKKHGNSQHYYLWLRKNNYPKGYRVLCHNCNQATSYRRTCPHKII